MVHPATLRAVRAAVTALGEPIDIGFVFPPKAGEVRGYGQWCNRDLAPAEVIALLPRAAAANARGGNIYMRLGPSVRDRHPGVVMVDDLTVSAVARLGAAGLEPCLVVETSPGNHQAWIRLTSDRFVLYETMSSIARVLAQRFGGIRGPFHRGSPGACQGSPIESRTTKELTVVSLL